MKAADIRNALAWIENNLAEAPALLQVSLKLSHDRLLATLERTAAREELIEQKAEKAAQIEAARKAMKELDDKIKEQRKAEKERKAAERAERKAKNEEKAAQREAAREAREKERAAKEEQRKAKLAAKKAPAKK